MKQPCLTVRRSTALSTPRKCAVRRTIQTGAPAVMHGQATHRHASTGTPLHNEKEPHVAATTRLSVNITNETAEALRSLAKEKGTTVTDIVRQATGLLKFIDTELKDSDQILLIKNVRTNETSRIQLL